MNETKGGVLEIMLGYAYSTAKLVHEGDMPEEHAQYRIRQFATSLSKEPNIQNDLYWYGMGCYHTTRVAQEVIGEHKARAAKTGDSPP